MSASLSIGDFSRASHLTVKTLRHYHRIGLLVPAEVDPHTGYRRYGTDQLTVAQVVRRFRDLDMPLDDIRAVLATPDPRVRGARIAAHLHRLEEQLARTRQSVDQLRELLSPAAADGSAVELCSTPTVTVAAVTDVIAAEDGPAWLRGALGELHATLTAQHLTPTGPPGGLYSDEVFTRHRGETTIFVPCTGLVRPLGRVRPTTVPAAELAVMSHLGPPADVDRTYSALATYVAVHALGVLGPIREYYLVGPHDTPDPTRWHTEIAWPVFRT